MPLPNRVSPFGELIADPARGTLFGNRGGKFHRDDRTLGTRRFASRQWICCVLAFKNRHRDVWGNGYTELFFLDEPTALAAGHRPCFECRRAEAQAFAAAFARGQGMASPPRAPEMDRILHAERLNGHAKRLHRHAVDGLPDGVFIVLSGHGAADLPSSRERSRAVRRVASNLSAEARRAKAEASGVGGPSFGKQFPPPLAPPHRFAALRGGRGTPAEPIETELTSERPQAFAIRSDKLLLWTPSGYGRRIPRPRGITVDVLTPPGIVAALGESYRPHWHRSAD